MKIILVILVVLSLMWSCQQSTSVSYIPKNDLYDSLEFEMERVALPVFPDRQVSIVSYGAVSNGMTSNTKAIAKAIADISKQGGGRVVIPRGIWLTGPIQLKSNINLVAEEGALVVFSKNFEEYPLIETIFEGRDTYRCLSPIYGKDLSNVAITGRGVFDGSGDAWRPVKKSKLTTSQWKDKIASGGILNEKEDIWYPSYGSLKGVFISDMNVPKLSTKEEHMAIKDFLRPVMVSLVNCKNVLLDGLTFQNSPAWCLHPLMCKDITVQNVTVRNPWYSQNGDGIDLESCKNAIIYKCTFDVGDDAICIKSGKGEDGRRRGIPTENTIIKDCIVYHGHGGFTVGSEMSGGVKNIHVSNLTFIGTDVGLRFKSTRGRGGVVENIYISSVNMIDIVAEAILFDLYYTGNSPIPEGDEKISSKTKAEWAEQIPKVSETTPAFKHIFIRDVTCKGAGRAVLLQGLPEMNLEDMTMSNIYIESTEGLVGRDLHHISMDNVSIYSRTSPVLNLYNCKAARINKLVASKSVQPIVKISGKRTDSISFKNSKLATANIEFGESVDIQKVEIQ